MAVLSEQVTEEEQGPSSAAVEVVVFICKGSAASLAWSPPPEQETVEEQGPSSAAVKDVAFTCTLMASMDGAIAKGLLPAATDEEPSMAVLLEQETVEE